MKKLFPLIGVAAATTALLAAGTASAASPGSDRAPQPAASVSSQNQPKVGSVTDTADVAVTAGGYTHGWGVHNGCKDFNLSGLGLPNGYPVTVSATETNGAGAEFIGSAWIRVNNVAVGNNVVSARICIDWDHPIPVNVHYVWG